MGANKEYILSKIPFISKFITDEPYEIIANSDVVVIVNNDEEFLEILNRIPEDKMIYDLVSINFSGRFNNSNYRGICW